MPLSAVIEARGLSKVFQTTVRQPGFAGALRSLVSPRRVDKVAVQDVEFSVGKGELLALLGPNGAGKSTTIKMLTGILTPTSGEALVAGVVPHRDRERNAHNIGAVFGQRTQLWWDLPARESFEILRDIYGVPRDNSGPVSRSSTGCSSSPSSGTPGSGICRWGSACVAISPPRCCTTRPSSSSTNPPSAWMWW